MKIKGFEDCEVIWSDRKRYFGLPLSFTRYAIVTKPGLFTKIVCIKGLLSTHVEEIHVYRIDDIGVFQSLTSKIFGVGNIDVYCRDASCDVLHILQVKNPMRVKSTINNLIEEERKNKNVRYAEMDTMY